MSFKPVGPAPQTDLLLTHFRVVPSISGLEANALYRIKSLPRRIMDLKRKGFEFRHEHKVDATGQRYVRYHYKGPAA